MRITATRSSFRPGALARYRCLFYGQLPPRSARSAPRVSPMTLTPLAGRKMIAIYVARAFILSLESRSR